MKPLRELACRANLELAHSGLVIGTFGNLSVVDRAAGVFAIKPSGVRYADLTPDKMVLVSLDSGAVESSTLRPSSDTPTHRALYRAFNCGAIAQARTPIGCMGTTHADYFRGDIPVTRPMTQAEVDVDYEENTGAVIVETFRLGNISPEEVPAVLVANHAPFTWGPDAARAIENARVLEFIAKMDWRARVMAPDAPRPDQFLVDKHYFRKHGKSAYYGQK
jgi:L-ribulose-5-phosphate 4-epimerase